MFCIRCGTQLPAGSRSCSRCGAEQGFGAGPESTMGLNNAFNRYMGGEKPLIGGRQPDDLVGQTIDGKYRLEAVLGAGGMGVVYRAARLLIGDTVAIKIILPEHVSDQRAIQRFRREAQATAMLKHPNAVAIYDFGTTSEGLVYLVMELIEGHSLRQIIREQGPLSPQAASVIINQVCSALDEAHRRNMVHRDLKPDNIIVTTTPSGPLVKVLDFGLAKMLDPETTSGNLTQTGTVMGTPFYMSPEQFMGDELDGRSDVYSLGIVLYEMLTGAVPFNSPTPTAVVVQHVNQAPRPLRAIDGRIPPAVEAVVLRALEKRRDARQQTAGALAQELSFAVRGETPSPQVFSQYPQGSAASQPAATGTGGTRETVPTMALNTPASGSNAFSHIASPMPFTGAPPPYSGEVPKAGGGRKLLPAVVAAVFALGLAGGGVAWWLLAGSDGSQAENVNQPAQEKTVTNRNSGASQSAKPEVNAANPADTEFRSLNEKRLNATPSEFPEVMESLKAAENRYPTDYRFTYERAKLSVAGTRDHHEAFNLLFTAGRKAIDAGKSAEMLSDMARDGGGDFRRLSRGHSEWQTLESALRSKDKTALSVSSH